MYFPEMLAKKPGQHRLFEIDKVKNGWMLTYFPQPNKADLNELINKQKEAEQERLARQLKEQVNTMKLVSEAIQAKESWQDEEEDTESKIQDLAEKMAQEPPSINNYLPMFGIGASQEPEAYVFTTQEELLAFLSCHLK